jgi:ABC-type transport system involved in multi-copper enzyme maturation permease subunit
MNQVWALVRKDLQIHARSIAVQLLGWTFLMRVLVQAQHALGLTKGQSLASMVISGSLGIFPLFAICSAQWLIERERGKETFAWIRALPVSDLHVVLAKFGGILAIGLIGGLGWRIATLGIDLGLTRWQLASSWMIWWAFAGVALFCQLMFSGRLAGVTPAFLYFVVAGFAFFVSRSPEASARVTTTWNDPWAHVWLWGACVGVEGVAVLATYRLFHSRDSQSLVE